MVVKMVVSRICDYNGGIPITREGYNKSTGVVNNE